VEWELKGLRLALRHSELEQAPQRVLEDSQGPTKCTETEEEEEKVNLIK
jgi:hypothetical protein